MADAVSAPILADGAQTLLATDLLQGTPAIAAFTGMTERKVKYRGEKRREDPDNPRLWPIYHDGCAYWARKSQLLEFARAGRFSAADLPATPAAA